MAKDYNSINSEIVSGLDIIAEYRSLGVRMARDSPRTSGKIPCYAVGRDDRNPSAYVDTVTGRYGDSKTAESISLWDFAARFSNVGDWQAARQHYADKAGVKLGTTRAADDWRTKLEFYDWTDSSSVPARRWCDKRRFAWGAARAAGARLVRWPCWVDKKTGEKKPGKYSCIAFPCYDHHLLDRDPIAWVLMNLFGDKLEIFRGKGAPPELVSKVSCGPTSGTLMNRHSLMRLQLAPQEIEVIWKTAGPTDMLALMSRLPAEKLATHLVTTNASGEGGDVPDQLAGVLAGQRVLIVHDADRTGDIGASKWLTALAPVAREVRQIRLPYEVTDKKGKDLRDYLDGYAPHDTSLPIPVVAGGSDLAVCG